MKKMTFVCLGNICRSPMAEYLAKELCRKNNINNIEISSCGTTNYHEGKFMHIETSKILSDNNIIHNDFKSKQITPNIFKNSDYIFVMDDSNLEDVQKLFGKDKKIRKITDFTKLNYKNAPDPWYTGNFKEVYLILKDCLINIFDQIKKNYL